VIETVVVAARIIQFLAATVLFGTPLFLLYGLKTALAPALGWPQPLFAACAGAVGLGALASLMAQTAVMAGHPAAAFDRETLFSILTDSAFGLAILIHAVAKAPAPLAHPVSPTGKAAGAPCACTHGLTDGTATTMARRARPRRRTCRSRVSNASALSPKRVRAPSKEPRAAKTGSRTSRTRAGASSLGSGVRMGLGSTLEDLDAART
jgi:hypothetical protein